MFKKLLALFLCFQLVVVNLSYAGNTTPINQTELDGGEKDGDGSEKSIDPGSRVFLDLTVFAIALFGFTGNKIINTKDVTEAYTVSKTIFRWSSGIYFMGAMIIAAMRLFWSTIDEDVSHVSQDLANPDHTLTKDEKESYITKVQKYIENKEKAILYVKIKMILTYALAAAWAVATIAASVEWILIKPPVGTLHIKSPDTIVNHTNFSNKFFNFLLATSFAKDPETTKAQNTSPGIQQVLTLVLGTSAIVLEYLTSLTNEWSILEKFPKMRIGVYAASTTFATLDANNFRTQLEKLNREKKTLETLLNTVQEKLTANDVKSSQDGVGLASNKLIDANTVFSSNKGVTLPDCTTNAATNPSCPKKINQNITDTPPALEELTKSGMNIGVAQNLFGNLSTMATASKAGNYNAGLSALLNSGAKNALNNSLKTLKKVAANYSKTAPTEEQKKFNLAAQTTEEMKKVAGIYNKVVAANKGSLAKMDSLPKGFDPIISDTALEKMGDKAVNLDSLVKLDEKEKVLEKPKAAFTVNHAASDEDAKKDEIMNLFSGTGEEEPKAEEANTAVKVVPENQESPDLTSSEIINDSSKNLFKLLSVRYFKTVYPLVLDSEAVVEVNPPLAPAENSRMPASK